MEADVRGIAAFALSTLAAGAVLATLTCAALAAAYGGDVGAIAASLREVDAAAIILGCAALFAASALFASAFASVRSTELGLRVAQDAERRDMTRFAAERTESAIDRLSHVAIVLNEAHALAGLALAQLDRIAEGVDAPLHQLAPVERDRYAPILGAHAAFAADAFGRLADAIARVGQDEVARLAMTHRGQIEAPALLPSDARDAPFLLADLAATPARVRIAALKLNRDPMWALIEARMNADAAVSGAEGTAEAQAARPLLFIGALIDAWIEREEGFTPHRLFLSGARFIADLVAALPDGEMLTAALKERYPGATPKRFKFVARFDPKNVVSPALARAADAARAMRALDYLEARPLDA